MRLRNIPRAEGVLEACKEVVKIPPDRKADGTNSSRTRTLSTSRSEWARDSSF